ncbi:hypothetical protein UFOVP718_12 [uncultured Caudovirales phage]|uniref:Uncharacterized protein n=1 Tax=uncultured Caudovirales phage TaxID=2100421 RepID=A0A6J5NRG3_9CAUD|nr:hypothetical protein UFOVP718_12 [uncultured Caudovirales phage]
MNIEQQILLLTRMVRLIDEMQTAHEDYLCKDKVLSHLRWSTEHLSNQIWARIIVKDYGTE